MSSQPPDIKPLRAKRDPDQARRNDDSDDELQRPASPGRGADNAVSSSDSDSSSSSSSSSNSSGSSSASDSSGGGSGGKRKKRKSRARDRKPRIMPIKRDPEEAANEAEESDVDSNAPCVSRSPSPQRAPTEPKKSAPKPTIPKAGSAYLPPAKARLLAQQISDKSSPEYQRLAWDALKKSINGLVNKVNVGNISIIVRELFQENLVRGRGILARSIMQAQNFSPTFTQVYAALVAVINTRLPQTGELLLKRLIVQFRKTYRRNDKSRCSLCAKFLAHLINQNVAHEIIGLEMLQLLLQENPTDDAVEVAITFLKDVGSKLAELSPRGLTVVMERLRHILHEGQVGIRCQYAIEVMMAIRKDGFKEHPSIKEGLDLVEEDDQITHMLQLDGKYQTEDMLNIFRIDTDFLENEAQYLEIKNEILGSDDESSSDSSNSSDDDSSDNEDMMDDEAMAQKAANARASGTKVDIFDKTETDIVHFRRTLYLTIQSSLDYEECAHKLLKIKVGEDETLIKEMCCMMVDCCQQQRTYEKFYGLLASRFCLLKKEFMLSFEGIFVEQYETIHRRDTVMLRNTGKMFSQMLFTDALPWSTLHCIRISEDTTSSSSRVFIKILFQDLAESMGLPKLAERLFDDTLQMYFQGLFPKDDPQDTRFAINFWTSIGLGGLTDDLREHLRFVKLNAAKTQKPGGSDSSSASSSDSSSEDEGPKFKKRRASGEATMDRRRRVEDERFFNEDLGEVVRDMNREHSRRPEDRRGRTPAYSGKERDSRGSRRGHDESYLDKVDIYSNGRDRHSDDRRGSWRDDRDHDRSDRDRGSDRRREEYSSRHTSSRSRGDDRDRRDSGGNRYGYDSRDRRH